MKCGVCKKKVSNWLRRENEVYCLPCYKSALEDRAGLSTQANEEANLLLDLEELDSRER
ncbi:MAG: hypothetical protein V3U26_06460 [Dehalococcoidia bacterium]